jgi:hypothetical protein
MLTGSRSNKFTGIIIRADKIIKMKRHINIIPLIIVAALFISCSQKQSPEEFEKGNPFSISFGSFKSYEKAFQFKSQLSTRVRAHLRFEYVGKKNYKLLYDRFPTSFAAGEKAFELYDQSYVKDYIITCNGQDVMDEFINVPFVANYLGKPCVFNYNLITKRMELVWSRENEKVVSLNLNRDASGAFILAASFYGKEGKNPSIQNLSLYYLHRNEEYSDLIEEFGNGYQVYSYWDTPDSFRVNVTYPDSIKAAVVNQKIQTWNSFGRKCSLRERSFNILKQGFPLPPERKPNILSPDKQTELRLVTNKSKTFIYLKNFSDKSELLITSTRYRIKDARWTSDSKFVFIITEAKEKNNDIKSTSKNELVILSADTKKVTRIIEGSGLQNLLVRGKLVFFDEYFGGSQRISIYDFGINKLIGKIEVPGGCSLNTLLY